MDEFKRCPNGHIRKPELEECPYCNGRTIEDDLEELPDDDGGPDKIPETAMCYDMGAY